MLISFHVGYIAMYNLKKVLVMNGRLVAKFYVYNVRRVVVARRILLFRAQL